MDRRSGGFHVRRVALVHWKIPPTVGGVESSLVDLAAVVRSLGYGTAIISGEKAPTEEFFPSVELVYSPALDVQLVSRSRAARDAFLQHLEGADPILPARHRSCA